MTCVCPSTWFQNTQLGTAKKGGYVPSRTFTTTTACGLLITAAISGDGFNADRQTPIHLFSSQLGKARQERALRASKLPMPTFDINRPVLLGAPEKRSSHARSCAYIHTLNGMKKGGRRILTVGATVCDSNPVPLLPASCKCVPCSLALARSLGYSCAVIPWVWRMHTQPHI